MADNNEAQSSGSDADATAQAMAAMGLPTGFSTPSGAAFGSPSMRPPPSGPSNAHYNAHGRGGFHQGRGSWREGGRGGRGQGQGFPGPSRDNGYNNARRQQQQQQQPTTHGAPFAPPTGPRNFEARRGSEKRKHDGRQHDNVRERGGGGVLGQALNDDELVPLDEVPPLIRPSMTEPDPWAHLE